MEVELKELLTIKQVTEYLSITRDTLKKWDIPRIRINRSVFYRKSDLEAWLDAHWENGGGHGMTRFSIRDPRICGIQNLTGGMRDGGTKGIRGCRPLCIFPKAR